MPPGRPRAFVESEVLERAMEVFWRLGYRGTSLEDLLDSMGIARQSLYSTFGSKRELFLRSVHHYRATRVQAALRLLESPGSPRENVRRVVELFRDLAADPEGRGCLVANTLVELGPHDPEIAALLEETLQLLEDGMRRALDRATTLGELPVSASPTSLAKALRNAILGMAVTGRLPAGRASLPVICAGALAILG